MKKVKVMGILNVTPDSFSDGGKYFDLDKAVSRALKMQEEGAAIIDVGGESTRPGADPVTVHEELRRVIPVIEELKTKLSIPISIDTMKPEVADQAVKAGAAIINDVSGFRDSDMVRVAADHDVTVCCMHMVGDPRNMQKNPVYKEGVMNEIIRWAELTLNVLGKGGISDDKIILDPGIGFGKTVAHNLEIIHNLPRLRRLGYPVLVGANKKSFMSQILNKPPAELLPSTIAVHTMAVMGGADIIRTNSVVEHFDAFEVVTRVLDC
ncbi:MAG: dihydropteroate synthase [Chlamydiota bacterium]|nr:dihydropteroate synthase [Chlamydiota bacterium]